MPCSEDVIFLGGNPDLAFAVGDATGETAAVAAPGLFAGYTSGAPGGYNVSLAFNGGWTTDFQNAFIVAAERISATIAGDLPDAWVGSGIVDDIQIVADLGPIDGVGGVVGQGGPTTVRTDSFLPATATMRFDSADAANFLQLGLFDELVTHEMLHSIGAGSLWGYLGLTSGPHFIGPNAVQAYNALVDEYAATHGGSAVLANGTVAQRDLLPLETGGGAGTAGAHWSESVFGNELMTGFLNAGADPLSALTVASLRDMGYAVSAAPPMDAYALT